MDEGTDKPNPRDYGLIDENYGAVLRWLSFETRWNRFMNPRAYKAGESKLWKRNNQESTLFDNATGLPSIVHYGIPVAVALSLYAGYLWFLIKGGYVNKLSIVFGFGGALLLGLGLAFVAMDTIKMVPNGLMQMYLRYIVSNLRLIKEHRHYHSDLVNFNEMISKTNYSKVGFAIEKCLICGETPPK